MLQSILLPIEFILLAAVAYMYWRTRQLAAEMQAQISSASLGKASEGYAGAAPEVWQAEMMHEVANLLTEWQMAANTAREDGLRQQAELQQTLKQAEATITELRTLLAQNAKSIDLNTKSSENTSTITSIPNSPPPVVSIEPQVGTIPRLNLDTWAEAIGAFTEQLQEGGYSQSTISRTLGHVRQFATWLSGPLYAQLPVRRLELLELASYRCYLETKLSQPHLIDRELIAIKTFANWINPLLGKDLQILAVESTIQNSCLSNASSKNAKVPETQSVDRYQAALVLADQGVDSATITTETGLEREAIRLLLTMRPPATA